MTEFGQQSDWIIYFAMVVAQAVVWAWLYNKAGPLREPMHRWVLKDERREQNILGNGHEKEMWSMWMIVAVHHGLGGILAAVGGLVGNIWLFRFGLSFEIGEDFLHFAKMIWTALGNYTEEFSVLWKEKHIWFGLACHHAVGAVGGSFVFIYIPDNPKAQYCVVMLLLSAVPQLFQFPFMPYENLKGEHVSCMGKIAALMTIGGSLFAFVARMFLFPPAAFELAGEVRPEYGDAVANSLLAASGLFMVFAVATLWMSAKEVWGAFKNLFVIARNEGAGAAIAKIGEQTPILLNATESFTLTTRKSIRSQQDVELIMAEKRHSRATLRDAEVSGAGKS